MTVALEENIHEDKLNLNEHNVPNKSCFGFLSSKKCVAGHDELSAGPPVQQKAGRNASLVKVSIESAVAGVPSENNEELVFCQWCGESSDVDNHGETEAIISID